VSTNCARLNERHSPSLPQVRRENRDLDRHHASRVRDEREAGSVVACKPLDVSRYELGEQCSDASARLKSATTRSSSAVSETNSTDMHEIAVLYEIAAAPFF
jgi:hypothetical protein